MAMTLARTAARPVPHDAWWSWSWDASYKPERSGKDKTEKTEDNDEELKYTYLGGGGKSSLLLQKQAQLIHQLLPEEKRVATLTLHQWCRGHDGGGVVDSLQPLGCILADDWLVPH